MKPFHETHPVRGNFGDPRTVFVGPATRATLHHGTGSFAFHAGIDIVAPDGTRVFPVRSGVVTSRHAAKVFVDSGNGVSHQYWHIHPEVRAGDCVIAYTTVLGRIRRSYGHVHFVELRHGRAINPLAAGHLSPYDDATAPRIGPLELHRPGAPERVLPTFVRGQVELVAPAYDDPGRAGPGEWATMPTVPVLVAWRVENERDGTIAVRERTAFDVRVRVPPRRNFWHVFARGTRQNMTAFKGHRYSRQAGVYLFRLGVLDTRLHPDGIYALVVTARDIRGNRATTRTTLLIYNGLNWPPRTPETTKTLETLDH